MLQYECYCWSGERCGFLVSCLFVCLILFGWVVFSKEKMGIIFEMDSWIGVDVTKNRYKSVNTAFKWQTEICVAIYFKRTTDRKIRVEISKRRPLGNLVIDPLPVKPRGTIIIVFIVVCRPVNLFQVEICFPDLFRYDLLK